MPHSCHTPPWWTYPWNDHTSADAAPPDWWRHHRAPAVETRKMLCVAPLPRWFCGSLGRVSRQPSVGSGNTAAPPSGYVHASTSCASQLTCYVRSRVRPLARTRARFNMNTVFPCTQDCHYKDKTVVIPSYLHNGYPYIGTMAYQYLKLKHWHFLRNTVVNRYWSDVKLITSYCENTHEGDKGSPPVTDHRPQVAYIHMYTCRTKACFNAQTDSNNEANS